MKYLFALPPRLALAPTKVASAVKIPRTGVLLLTILSLSLTAFAQEEELVAFEKKIEQAVVDGNVEFLKKAYADDFRFKHGTGLVDSKDSWIKTVEKSKGKYLSRVGDSLEVEIHDKIGITNGKLTVTRKNDTGVISKYAIKYVRVYIRKENQWQLISHRTVQEVHY